MTISPALPALIACTRMAIQRTWIYRSRMVLWIIRNVIMLFSLRMIWTAVYGDRDVMNGVTLHMMIVYVTIAMLQQYLIDTVSSAEIERRVQRGTVAGDLIRPVGLIPQMLAYDVGFVIGRIPLILVMLPFAALVGSLALPPTALSILGYLVSLLLAYILSVLIWLPVGLLGFWVINATGIRFLMFSVLAFVSGQMVPLWFMPDGLRTLLEWLPFQGMAYTPLSIYVGQLEGAEIVRALGIQAAWIMVMAILVRWIWSKAQNVVQIQGG